MARVDPFNDEIRRFVIHRVAYDPARHERRAMVVAAFDDEAEYRIEIARLWKELRDRREACGDVDQRDRISGVVWEPGHARKHAAGRIAQRAITHGADLKSEEFEGLLKDLPSNMGVFFFETPKDG